MIIKSGAILTTPFCQSYNLLIYKCLYTKQWFFSGIGSWPDQAAAGSGYGAVGARHHSRTRTRIRRRKFLSGFRIRNFFQIPNPGVCTSNGEIFSNEMNVLDTIKRHLFCFLYFWCQMSPVSARAPDPDLVRIFSRIRIRGSSAFRGRLTTKV